MWASRGAHMTHAITIPAYAFWAFPFVMPRFDGRPRPKIYQTTDWSSVTPRTSRKVYVLPPARTSPENVPTGW